jgi:hypothetical protein
MPAMIRPSAIAGLVQCRLCKAGSRRVDGVHVTSDRPGITPLLSGTPCRRVFATHVGQATEGNERPWMAYVDGDPVRRKSGDARRFASAEAAYAAACKAAPKRWHP